MQKSIRGLKSRISLSVIFIVLVTIIFGMHGGTPIEHGDSLTPKAKHTVRHFGNPNFFIYPALMIYLNAVEYSVYEVILKILPHKVSNILDKWPYRDLPGHLLTILFSIIGALSVYGICFILTKSTPFAMIGALLLIFSPLWNANTHYITVDIPLSALCVLTVFILLYYFEKNSTVTVQQMVVLGILTGLSASAKYNGALIASAVVVAVLLRIKPLIYGLKLLIVCGMFAIITFFITNPFIIINFKTFVQDFLYASNLVTIGHPGFTVNTVHHHISESIYLGWNPGAILLSIIGIVLITISRKINVYFKLAILVFPFLHLVILLKTKMTFHRYALPLIPFFAVFAAYTLFCLWQYHKNHYHKYQRPLIIIIISGAIILAIGVNLFQSLSHNIVLQKTDTRTILGELFTKKDNDISGLKIGAGDYCVNFLGISAKKEVMSRVRNSDVQISRSEYDILALDSFTHDRYITDENMRLQIDFTSLQRGRLIKISPYVQKKTMIPFSPMSMYSPYYPDLPYRLKPGPYIEIYFADPQLALTFSRALSENGYDNSTYSIKQGYYFAMFSKGVGAEDKPLSDKSKKINQQFFDLFQKRKNKTL